MATENYQQSDVISLLTDEAVTKNLAGKLATGGEVENCDTAGEQSVGVVLDTETAVGEDVGVLRAGFKLVVSGAAFSDGDPLATDTAGKYRTATTGQWVIAKAQGEATAADELVRALVFPMAAYRLGEDTAGIAAAAIIDLTDSTGYSGTHDDTLAATTVPTITATNPAAPTAYAAVVTMTNPVTKTEGEAVSAALATLRSEVATYETAISALVVDVAAILALVTVMSQNQSDVAQKVKELIAAL